MALTKVTSGLISADASSVDLNIDAGTLYIDATNNRVGIGTTSPVGMLEITNANPLIYQSFRSSRADGNDYTVGGFDSLFRTRDSNVNTGAFIRVLDVNTNPSFPTTVRGGVLSFGTVDGISGSFADAEERMRIDSSGNVGLGTTSPQNLSGQKSITINGSVARVDFKIADTFRHAIITESQYLALSIDPDNTQANSRLAVLVDNTERMRIDSSGNVGIGTSSPAQKLNIDTGVTSTNQGVPATSGTTQNGILRLQPGAATYGETLDIGMNVGTTYAWIQPTNSSNLATNYNLALNPNGGNVGINQSTPTQKLEVVGKIVATEGITTFAGDPTNYGLFRSGTAMQLKGASTMQIESGSGSPIVLYTNGGYERMRLTSAGAVLIGTSTGGLTSTGTTFNSNGTGAMVCNFTSANEIFSYNNNNATGASYEIDFRQNNTEVGKIAVGSSTTSYATSSDYRLKENIQPLINGLERVKQLNPVQFDWKKDGTSSEGFIAHEVQEIFSDAVVGEKDGEKMQGMDYGRITPLLVKATQELSNKVDNQQVLIEQLQAEVALLKGE